MVSYEIRPIAESQLPAYIAADGVAFSEVYPQSGIDSDTPTLEVDRTLAAFDGKQLVGGASVLSMKMTVPGGDALPTGGVTWVSVQPSHRRQGILTEMMKRQMGDIHERGEPLAALWASESSIYGRFGFGPAVECYGWEIERARTRFAVEPARSGVVRMVDAAEARRTFPQVWERTRPQQPGMTTRSEARWDRTTADSYSRVQFRAVHETDGLADGYLTYRVKTNWPNNLAANEVTVAELIAASGEAHAALWTFALDIDLSGSVRGDNMAVDDPIQWMLADPRRLVRRRRDAVWLRIVDVPTALAGRRYGSSGRLVIDVSDSFCDWMAGRYALQASPDGASCRPTTDSAELALSAAALGAIYLGGVRASTLARAGQIEERTSGALLRADELFASDRAPWNPDFF